MIVKVCKLEFIKTLDGLKKVGVDTIEPKLPTYGKEGDACIDIYPIYCEWDSNKDRWIYHTGLAFAIGNSLIRKHITEGKIEKTIDVNVDNEMEIRPRSNLTKSDFYMPNSPGTLDAGYRGELLIIFKNRTSIHLVQAVNNLSIAIDKLAMRTGHAGEIKQYTSSIRIQLSNVLNSINNAPYNCDGNDRCAQLIIRGRDNIVWREVQTVEELGTTERGDGGFGSTQGCSNLK